jgi:hypothetical protein
MQAFDVYHPTRNGKLKLIDTVFANGYDAEEMRTSLINHDGYPSDIVVKKCRRKG